MTWITSCKHKDSTLQCYWDSLGMFEFSFHTGEKLWCCPRKCWAYWEFRNGLGLLKDLRIFINYQFIPFVPCPTCAPPSDELFCINTFSETPCFQPWLTQSTADPIQRGAENFQVVLMPKRAALNSTKSHLNVKLQFKELTFKCTAKVCVTLQAGSSVS